MTVTSADGFDQVAFAFGPSETGSGVGPGVILRPVEPPFVEGASGLPLPVEGDLFVELTFRDMVVADAQGNPTNPGPARITPGTVAVRQVVQAEAFEGIVRWIIGLQTPGCVRVANDAAGRRILVQVQQP